MVKCCAPMCTNAPYNKSPEITFHRFPKDQVLKNKWVKNMNRKNWHPKPTSVLCSEHFEPNLICWRNIRTVLKPGAIPTIFKGPLVEQGKENLQTAPLLHSTTAQTSTTPVFPLHSWSHGKSCSVLV